MAYRLIFMGSDPIALPGLEAVRDGSCGAIEIVAVYTQPDRPRGRGQQVAPNAIKQWALQHGYAVYQPERVGKATRLEVAALRPDSILVMAYGHLLSQAMIDVPRCGIWNLHTSLLPRYRGASPIQCAVASGDAETGVSLMRLAREMDAGPVLDVERVSIGEEDTALDVEHRLAAACAPLLVRNLPLVHAGEAQPVAQDVGLVSYVRKLGKDDGDLDFGAPASVVARRINGLFPWPGARALHGGVFLKVGLAVCCEGLPAGARPGELLGVEREGLRVACGEGVALLKRLQRPGGRMLDAWEFARGYELPVGSCFESRLMPELVAAQPFGA